MSTPVVEAGWAVSADQFRRGMRCLGGGVTIVATRYGGERRGMTATAVCSFSDTPARILACVSILGSTYQFIAKSRCIAINVLARHQEEVARRFARMSDGPSEDPFGTGQWTTSRAGMPILTGALATFDCDVNEIFVMHNRAILIGAVREISFGDRELPLIYLDGTFMTATSA